MGQPTRRFDYYTNAIELILAQQRVGTKSREQASNVKSPTSQPRSPHTKHWRPQSARAPTGRQEEAAARTVERPQLPIGCIGRACKALDATTKTKDQTRCLSNDEDQTEEQTSPTSPGTAMPAHLRRRHSQSRSVSRRGSNASQISNASQGDNANASRVNPVKFGSAPARAGSAPSPVVAEKRKPEAPSRPKSAEPFGRAPQRTCFKGNRQPFPVTTIGDRFARDLEERIERAGGLPPGSLMASRLQDPDVAEGVRDPRPPSSGPPSRPGSRPSSAIGSRQIHAPAAENARPRRPGGRQFDYGNEGWLNVTGTGPGSKGELPRRPKSREAGPAQQETKSQQLGILLGTEPDPVVAAFSAANPSNAGSAESPETRPYRADSSAESDSERSQDEGYAPDSGFFLSNSFLAATRTRKTEEEKHDEVREKEPIIAWQRRAHFKDTEGGVRARQHCVSPASSSTSLVAASP